MGGGGGEGGGGGYTRELDETPTWAVASVCGVIILISILLEKGLHHLGQSLAERQKKALFEALEKIKNELMILGFISLLLTFGQTYIIQICIPEEAAKTMLPCRKVKKLEPKVEPDDKPKEGGSHRRSLLWGTLEESSSRHRMLAEASPVPRCTEGTVPLISLNGLHQLHIFIFFLAIFHVFYSAITMALGRAKIHAWKEWEHETTSLDYEFSNDPARFRFAHETSFVKQHSSFWNRTPFVFYIVSFFRQFFRSVGKTDYLSLRHGFVTVHLAPGSKFHFQKYIERALEDDFKVIVGISPALWASAVIFLLLNVKGWLTLFWISLLPLLTILAVGTKLQAIISTMAIEIKERHAVVQGIPLVHLSDQHFWFRNPRFILFLIHFTLFQNAFQLIYFLWIWYEFGLDSCFQDSRNLMIARISFGIAVQVLCSYITLPLYALVSQMGSHMKKSVFDEHTSRALKKWRLNVKKKNSANPRGSTSSPPRTVHSLPQLNACLSSKPLYHSPSGRRRHSDQGVQNVDAEVLAAAIFTTATDEPPTDLLTGSAEQPQQQHAQEDKKGDERQRQHPQKDKKGDEQQQQQQHARKDEKGDEFTFLNLQDP